MSTRWGHYPHSRWYWFRGAGQRTYGPVSAEIDGKRLSKSPNLYVNADTSPAGSVEFGEALLDPGKHVLKLVPMHTQRGLPTIALDRIELASRSRFIAPWYLIGPFDNPGDAGLETPYPPETESFDPGAAYTGKDGRQIGWQEINKADLIYIQDLLKPNEMAVAYARTHVVSPDGRTTELLLGSDDYAKVWLNGELVWRNRTGRSLAADQDRVVVTLKQGVNTLLLKIVQGGGRWGYVARFRDPAGELEYCAAPPRATR